MSRRPCPSAPPTFPGNWLSCAGSCSGSIRWRFTLTCHGRTLRRFTTDALAATSDNQAAALRFAEAFLTDELTSPANNVGRP